VTTGYRKLVVTFLFATHEIMLDKLSLWSFCIQTIGTQS